MKSVKFLVRAVFVSAMAVAMSPAILMIGLLWLWHWSNNTLNEFHNDRSYD